MAGNINLYPRGMYPRKIVYCVSDFTQWINENYTKIISKIWSRHLNEFKGAAMSVPAKVQFLVVSQPAFICPKLTILTLEQGVKYVQSKH